MSRELKKRKNYLIKKDFQLKYIILGILILVLTICLVQVNLYYQMAKLISENPELTGISAIIKSTNVILTAWFILAMIIIVIGGVFISHRVAGPIKHLEEGMAKVGQGELTTEIKVRKTDEFKEIEQSFNNMVANFKELVAKDKSLLKQIEQELKSIVEELKKEALSEEKTKKLEAIIKKQEEIFSEFKI